MRGAQLDQLGRLHRYFVYVVVGLMLAVFVGVLLAAVTLLLLALRTLVGWL